MHVPLWVMPRKEWLLFLDILAKLKVATSRFKKLAFKHAFQDICVFGSCTICTTLIICHVIINMMSCTLWHYVFKKYVHMFMKHAESNRKMQDIEVAMGSVRKFKPRGLRARWPKGIDSLGYYKT